MEGVLQWGRFGLDDGRVIDAFEPLQNTVTEPDKIGFPFSFGKIYRSTFFNRRVLLIPAGEGGASFSGNDWNPGDPNYVDLVNRANAIMQQYPDSVIAGIFWQHGETDALVPWTEVQYATALDTMIAGIRSEVTGATNAPLVVGEMAQDWVAADLTREPVQLALQDTTNRIANSGLVSSSGLVTFDGIHFDATSQRTLGQRYYDVYLTLSAPEIPNS